MPNPERVEVPSDDEGTTSEHPLIGSISGGGSRRGSRRLRVPADLRARSSPQSPFRIRKWRISLNGFS